MRQVLAIGRHGSFSKAAKELGIAQPTLSKSVARLEDELGVMLFDRSGWRAQMTPMGEFFVEQAAGLVNEAHRLDRNIQLIARGEIGEVKIGLGPALHAAFMPKLAAEIITRHPKLKLVMMADSATGLLQGVNSGAYDMILVADTAIAAEVGLVNYIVIEEPGIAVAAPGHPLEGKAGISVAEFGSYNVIGSATSSTSTPVLYTMPELSRKTRTHKGFDPMIVTNDLETTLDLVRKGVCIYAGPAHVVMPSIHRGELSRLDVDWSFTYRAVAAMTVAASLSPMLRQIVGYAQTVGSNLVAANGETATGA